MWSLVRMQWVLRHITMGGLAVANSARATGLLRAAARLCAFSPSIDHLAPSSTPLVGVAPPIALGGWRVRSRMHSSRDMAAGIPARPRSATSSIACAATAGRHSAWGWPLSERSRCMATLAGHGLSATHGGGVECHSDDRSPREAEELVESLGPVELAHEEHSNEISSSSSSSSGKAGDPKQRKLCPDVPTILIHGVLGNKRNFRSFSKLVKSRRVVTVDLRNHGDSGRAETMTFPEMAADVVQLMNKLRLNRAAVVGHSLGGKVAMAMTLMFPSRVACLVSLDMSPVDYNDPKHAELPRTREGVSTRDMLRFLVKMPMHTFADKQQVLSHLSAAPWMTPAMLGFLMQSVGFDSDSGRAYWKVNLHGIHKQL
eukprot:GHVU01108978.1.p1 GENE.GHVU01108978.1~~GHVU01108978.1.p1  ORF type:complete len:372 (+),score=37.11 GHVU01108978.1:1445-2560(+)